MNIMAIIIRRRTIVLKESTALEFWYNSTEVRSLYIDYIHRIGIYIYYIHRLGMHTYID